MGDSTIKVTITGDAAEFAAAAEQAKESAGKVDNAFKGLGVGAGLLKGAFAATTAALARTFHQSADLAVCEADR